MVRFKMRGFPHNSSEPVNSAEEVAMRLSYEFLKRGLYAAAPDKVVFPDFAWSAASAEKFDEEEIEAFGGVLGGYGL